MIEEYQTFGALENPLHARGDDRPEPPRQMWECLECGEVGEEGSERGVPPATMACESCGAVFDYDVMPEADAEQCPNCHCTKVFSVKGVCTRCGSANLRPYEDDEEQDCDDRDE